MNKEKILNRLHVLESLVKSAESNMKLAIISYSKYQEELKQISEELDILEQEIKDAKSRSIFDIWFGNPLRQLEDLFNVEVHEAIDKIEEDR